MPLCFWAKETAVAASDLCVGAGRSKFTPYLPPHSAATVIQHAYQSYVSVKEPVRALHDDLAHFNADLLARFHADMACFNADLAKCVGCSERPVLTKLSSSGLPF
jgi:hypothetical protein